MIFLYLLLDFIAVCVKPLKIKGEMHFGVVYYDL